MVGRPCLDCGAITHGGPRCPTCTRTHRRSQGSATARGYNAAWARHAQQAITDYRARHGDICPGFRREPHAATDWACDHDLGPMCRSCNARKAATADRARANALRRR